MSDSRTEGRHNSGDNVFDNIPVGKDEARLFGEYLDSSDLSANSQRAIVNDLRKFARWFVDANQEPLTFARVTTRDITDFRDSLRRDQEQAVATVNRALVSVRRFCRWLCEDGHLQVNPAKGVKELRKQELAPKGLDRAQVRRLFREVELRNDVRANAVFSSIIYTGCRVGDLVSLTLGDLLLSERSGTAVFRSGKGNKQRSVPVPLAARKALVAYLETRPPVEGDAVFVGERGPLSDKGVRCLCDKYSVVCGFKIHPHLLRHTMAHKFLEDNPGDLVSLAQILGHENLNTTKRYVARTEQELADASERMQF
ncbi:integrase [Bremerella cremea]|uniref:Integrase n=1 Tax=Bremerella cremea TaxID=1031537 RepID=A0A368KQ57_9BACT|nr:tyrosine-type recombinase/integrase [Bremerella cremea]RCS47803.1 integrase [Bremerella cremea]